MGLLLLGVDSLIACIAVGPIIRRRAAVPFAGLAIGMGIAYAFPVIRRHMALASGIAGAALIAAAGVLPAVG